MSARGLGVQASTCAGLRRLVVYPVPLTIVVDLLLTLTSKPVAGLRLCRLRGWLTAGFTKKKLRSDPCDLPFSLRLGPRNYPIRTLRQQLILAKIYLPKSFPSEIKRTHRNLQSFSMD